jgi:hypothetical protein
MNYQPLIENLEKDVIVDVKLKNTNENCTDGYEGLIDYEWPGTVVNISSK